MNANASPESAPGAAPLSFPPLVRLRFVLRAEEDIRLPAYAGSAWRGLLGHGLRRTACVTRQQTCDGCLLVQSCAYSTLFETPAPPASADLGYTRMPHPFVLDIDPKLPRMLAPGAEYPLLIHLLGAAIGQAPYFIQALNVAGQRGVGKPRGRFSVARVDRERVPGDGEWQPVYDQRDGVYSVFAPSPLPSPPPAPTAAHLRFVTPLRIKHDGRFLGARQLTAAHLVRALYRRLETLSWLQGGGGTGFDPRAASVAADALELRPDRLRWYEWTRYSSRQDTLMQFGGLIGEAALHGAGLSELWPALWLGQWTHVGKGTAFGLGGYRIAAEPGSAPGRMEPSL